MTFAKIVVPVAGIARDAVALAAALRAAGPFNAHVQAVFAHPNPQAAVPNVGVPFSLEVVGAVIDGQEQVTKAGVAAARAALAAAAVGAQAEIVAAPRKAASVTCSLREIQGRLPAVAAVASQLSDLVVFGPLHNPEFADLTEAFLDILTKAGRPVLIAPEKPLPNFARDIAVGWDGSLGASRALIAALPLLGVAKTVTLLCVHDGAEAVSVDDAMQYLELHGLGCAERRHKPQGRPVGEALAQAAQDCGADLLVLGGYGHSHLRETIFGGVTSDILFRPTMPIFLAH